VPVGLAGGVGGKAEEDLAGHGSRLRVKIVRPASEPPKPAPGDKLARLPFASRPPVGTQSNSIFGRVFNPFITREAQHPESFV